MLPTILTGVVIGGVTLGALAILYTTFSSHININFSKFVSNKVWSAKLFDIFFFRKNRNLFDSGNLFIVFSKNSDSLLEKILSAKEKTKLKQKKEKEKEAFQYVRFASGNFLFVNKEIFCMKDETSDEINDRLTLFIKQVKKYRGDFLLDGLIFLPEESDVRPQKKTEEESAGLTAQPVLVSKVYQEFTKKFRISIPIYFLLDNMMEGDVFQKVSEFLKNDPKVEYLGILNDDPDLKIENESVSRVLTEFMDAFELKVRGDVSQLTEVSPFKEISFSLQLNLLLSEFKNNYLTLLYSLIENEAYLPYIRGVLLFDKDELPRNLTSFEKTLGFLSNYEAGLTQQFESVIQASTKKLNIYKVLSLVTTLLSAGLLYKAYLMTHHKSGDVVDKFKELAIYIRDVDNDYSAPPQGQSFNKNYYSQGCELLNQGNILSTLSFYNPILLPSMIPSLDDKIIDLYTTHLGTAISTHIVDDFNIYLKSTLEFDADAEVKESDPALILAELKNYLSAMKAIDAIYAEMAKPVESPGEEKKEKGIKIGKETIGKEGKKPTGVKNGELSRETLKQMALVLYQDQCKDSVFADQVFDHLNIAVIKNSVHYQLADLKSVANVKLEGLARRYLKVLGTHNDLVKNAKTLSAHLEILLESGGTLTPDKAEDPATRARLDELVQYFNSVGSYLAVHSSDFKDAPTFSGAGFQAALSSIGDISFFGKDKEGHLQQILRDYFNAFKTSTLNMSSDEFGAPTLTYQDQSGFSINPLVVSFIQNVADILSFLESPKSLAAGASGAPTTIFTGKYGSLPEIIPGNSYWIIEETRKNVGTLALIEKIFDSFDATKYNQDVNVFYTNYIQYVLHAFWKERLSSCFAVDDVTVLPAAQVVTGDPGAIEDFIMGGRKNSVSKDANIPTLITSLKTLTGSFDKHSLPSDKRIVVDIINKQISFYLNRYQNQLNISSVYKMGVVDFSWWDGTTSPGFRAFGATSTEDLKSYDNTQKLILQDLMSLKIGPLLDAYGELNKDPSFLNTQDTGVKNWAMMRSIFSKSAGGGAPPAPAAGADAKAPVVVQNPLEMLSSFVIGELNTIRTPQCFKFLTNFNAQKVQGTDFFTARYLSLANPLVAQCQVLFAKQSIQNYNDLVASFNQSLGGNFPFAPAGTSSFADVNNLFAFNTKLAEFNTNNLPFVKATANTLSSNKNAMGFVDNMTTVAKFLNVQIGKEGMATSPQFNLSFAFRTQRTMEVLGNQILNWTLQIGKNNIGSNYGQLSQGKILWTYGDPLTFTVTIANSSRFIPFGLPGTYFKASGYNVFVNDTSPWSLMNFVNYFSTCKDPAPCKTQLLKFVVPVTAGKQMIFYSTISFEDVQTRKILEYPFFPTSALPIVIPPESP